MSARPAPSPDPLGLVRGGSRIPCRTDANPLVDPRKGWITDRQTDSPCKPHMTCCNTVVESIGRLSTDRQTDRQTDSPCKPHMTCCSTVVESIGRLSTDRQTHLAGLTCCSTVVESTGRLSTDSTVQFFVAIGVTHTGFWSGFSTRSFRSGSRVFRACPHGQLSKMSEIHKTDFLCTIKTFDNLCLKISLCSL